MRTSWIPNHIMIPCAILIVSFLAKTAGDFDFVPPSRTPANHRSMGNIFSSKQCDCLRAKYTWMNMTFLLDSFVDESTAQMFSNISVLDARKNRTDPIQVTKLQLPAKYLHSLVIDGLSQLLTSSAQNTLAAIDKSDRLDIDELLVAYDNIFRDLHRATRGWPHTHGRSAIFYHSSILHAVKRLREGVSPRDACPPHEAYATGRTGLFVCRQEYEQLVRGATENSSWFHKKLTLNRTEGTVDFNLDDVVEGLARWNACGSLDCVHQGCAGLQYNLGWHIYGNDDGCCLDYSSCCVFAGPVCFFHDVICNCCSHYICPEPFCKPAPGCPNSTVV